MKSKIEAAVGRLREAIDMHRPIAVFGLFSGGHDSFSASYIASQVPEFTAIVHINTGIGVDATRDYVRQTCHDRDWKLIELKAIENTNAKGEPDPQSYEAICLKWGFPGPFAHRIMYSKLKERQLVRLSRMYSASSRAKRRIMLVSGVRTHESVRRMGNAKEIQHDGNRIWMAPIHDWTKLDTSNLLEHTNQPRNLIVDLIHKSGECLCGAFAKKGELEELSLWPQTRPAHEEIMRIQALVKPLHGWGWGEKPLRKQGCVGIEPAKQHLCQTCFIEDGHLEIRLRAI